MNSPQKGSVMRKTRPYKRLFAAQLRLTVGHHMAVESNGFIFPRHTQKTVSIPYITVTS